MAYDNCISGESGGDCDSDSDSSGEKRRRRNVRAVAARVHFGEVAELSMAEERMRSTGVRRRAATRKDWLGHVSQEGFRVFRRMYRMEINNFNELMSRVGHKLETDDVEMAVRSSGSPVCAEVRLAMTLRYLAGGSVWDIRSNFGVSSSEFYRSVWRVVDALNEEIVVELDISDECRLKELADGFAKKSRRNAIRGAIGAIDGCTIWQKNPGVAVHNPNRYYCARKEKCALLLMEIADADRKIIWFYIRCAPSTHDSLAWLTTELGQRIDRGELSDKYYILGDSAFTCTISMITPGADDAFNFEQRSLRINVECAFGELIRLWGTLWRPLEMEFRKRSAVIGCCVRLHNYCVDCRIHMDENLMQRGELVESMPGQVVPAPFVNEHGVPTENLHNWCRCPNCSSQTRANVKADTRRRVQLEAIIRELGLRRPYRPI